jgi:hypothetical protein
LARSFSQPLPTSRRPAAVQGALFIVAYAVLVWVIGRAVLHVLADR